MTMINYMDLAKIIEKNLKKSEMFAINNFVLLVEDGESLIAISSIVSKKDVVSFIDESNGILKDRLTRSVQ